MSVGLLRRGLPSTAGVSAPADKRFRRPDVRPGRRRGLGVRLWQIGRIAIGAAVVLGGGVWLAESLLGTKLLSVSHVVVRGNRRLSTGEVEALVNGVRGQSTLLVDLDQYRLRLMDSPWVAGATLRRVLPSTVEVGIAERTPMAVARLGQQLYLVDNTGVIIDEFGPQYRDLDLPVVDGLVQTPGRRGPAVAAAQVVLTERLLDDLRSAPALRRRVSQLDVADAHDVVVLLDDDTVLVHVGETRFVDRLTTYLELAPTLRERLREIDSVDMRFDERVYVRSKGQAGAVAIGRK
jgi:cell division protein FtsQ